MSNLEQAVAVTALADAITASSRPRAQSRRGRHRLMSLDEAAEALGMSRSTLYRQLAGGRLPSVKIGRRRLIPSSAIAERKASDRARGEMP